MTVQFGDATALPLEDESVHCIVTSPPYNVGVEYEGYNDSRGLFDYQTNLVYPAAAEMYRVLVPGGRLWLNVAPTTPHPSGSVERLDLAACWHDALRHEVGFRYRDTVVWIQDSFDGQCAWGSWRQPSAPNQRGSYEVVLCFYKGPEWKRERPEHIPAGWQDGADPDLVLVETPWQDLCRNVWTIRPARRREDAPAPFPIELPRRCIRLSTWPGETVLDPFAGSGTTVIAAKELGRVGVGFDIGAPTYTEAPDADCFTLPNGDCVAEECRLHGAA